MRAVLLLAAALAAVVGISAGSAATETKPYAAVFDAGPVPAGSTVTIDLVLENQSNPQSIGSSNVTAPNGFQITGATIPSGAGTVETSSTLLKLRNLEIAPLTSRLVEITVQTPCTPGAYTWEIRSKQSNNFSGPPGNDFFLVAEDSNVVTTVGGGGPPDSIAFTVQPGDGQVATTGDPTAEVTVYDACGNVATGAGGSVTVALVPPADPTFGGADAVLGGTKTEGLVDGVASFDDLSVSKSAQGYTLDATYGGDTITSDEFSIYDFYGPCASPPCGVSDDTTIISLGTASTATVGLSLKANSSATCQGLSVLGSAFTVVPPPGHTAYDIPVTLTINKRGLQGVGVANIKVCKNSGPGTDLVELGKCPKKGTPKAACIVSQTASNAGDAEITILINSTDPGGAGFG